MKAKAISRKQESGGSGGKSTGRNVPMKQSDVPSMSLEEALRVPRALADQYAARPTTVLNVAAAMSMQPASGPFRMLTGAAVAYGLTSGTAFSDEIELTPLGKRVLRPTTEGDDVLAKREALLKPRVVGEFLKRYNNAPIPRDDIALNVLVEMGVPQARARAVFNLIVDGAGLVGLIRDIKGKRYFTLEGVPLSSVGEAPEGESVEEDDQGSDAAETTPPPASSPARSSAASVGIVDKAAKRVYITHGRNTRLVETIKKLLAFGELDPVVSVERTSVAQPVPDKIMEEMRSCGAAIIHVDAEQRLIDTDTHEHIMLNPNVLIEIGAAMALYGRRFILLVKEGITLPSNLQGLYEVRYTGESVDADGTVRLLEAIRDIKNRPMPQV